MKERCERYQNIMADVLAGEASADEQMLLQQHMADCRACAAEFAELEAVQKAVKSRSRPELDDAFWAGYMERLDEKLDRLEAEEGQGLRGKLLKMPTGNLRWRRLLMPVAAAALVVIGVFIGRMTPTAPGVLIPGSGPSDSTGRTQPAAGQNPRVMMAHLDNVEPFLMELKNRSAGETMTVDSQLLRDLLMQNYMLKRMVARQNDPVRQALLDDLELILLEMSAGSENGAGNQNDAQKMIEENGVLFRLRLMRQGEKSL